MNRTIPRARQSTAYRRKGCLVLAGAAIFSLLSHSACGVDLVRDREAKCQIILDEKASGTEELAARELQTYFSKVASATVPVQSGAASAEGRLPLYLVIEGSALANKFGIEGELKKLSEEGFLTRVTPTEIVIAARKPIGVLYGAYTFIEDHLGVRWFMPGEDGEYAPTKESVAVEEGTTIQNPRFSEREIKGSCQSNSAFYEATWEWMARNKMQIVIGGKYQPFHKDPKQAKWLLDRNAKIEGGGHTLAKFVPNETFFETNPEYFALVGGQRRKSNAAIDAHGNVYQRCLSRPEVIDLGARYVEEFMTTEPKGNIFLIGNNDGGGWCECAECVALSDPDELKRNRVSTYFFRYINEVTGRVLEKQPDANIRAWGYQNFRDAPKGLNLNPKLTILLALHGRCYRHALEDKACPTNGTIREIMKTWSGFPNRMGVREYYSNFVGGGYAERAVIYVPMEDITSRDIRYLASLGYTSWTETTPFVDGIFPERFNHATVRDNWRARFPDYYIAAKLLWNPDADTELLKQEVADGYFGKASKPMKAYREALSKTWQGTAGEFVFNTSSVMLGRSLADPAIEKELLHLLEQAQKAAKGDPVIEQRVAFEREHFESVWIAQAKILQQSEAWADVNAIERKAPVVIDGSLDEPDWQSASTVSGFNTAMNTPAKEQTSVKVMYDEDAIYFGIEAFEPNVDKLRANAGERDDRAIWKDDLVEIFIEPGGLDASYTQIAINPKGVIYDARCVQGGQGDASVQLSLEAETRVLGDRWVTEVRIPAKTLQAEIRKAGIWKVNVGRNRKTEEPRETSSWSDGGFHYFSSFRSVVFGSEPPLVTNGGFEDVVELDTEKKLKRYTGSKKTWQFGQTPPLFPNRWSLHEQTEEGVLTMETEDVYSGRYAAKIENGWFFQIVPVAVGKPYQVSFQAKGSGRLTLRAFLYSNDEKGVRSHVGTPRLETFELGDEWSKLSAKLLPSVPGVTEIGIVFCIEGTLLLDDVLVQEEKE